MGHSQPEIQAKQTPNSVRFVIADENDEPNSLGTKLAELGGQRVALVLPDDVDSFDGPVAIHVLARAARRESVRLALVSGRRSVRTWAEREGLPTFSSSSKVPRFPDSSRTSLLVAVGFVSSATAAAIRTLIPWLGAIGVVFLIGLLVVLSIPRAVVTVKPVVDDLKSTVRVQASIDATEPDPLRGIIPGREVYLKLEGNGTIPIERPDHPLDGRAVGWETFENRTTRQVPIPKGTVVSTFGGIPFATMESATLPARGGATVTVPIKALNPGPSSNVKRGEVISISGNLRWLIVGVNEDQIAGGGNWGEPITTAWDARKLVDQVTAQAESEARKTLAAQAGAGESIVAESVRITPIEESFSARVGSTTKDLSLRAQFRIAAMIVNASELEGAAVAQWHPVIRAGYSLKPDSVTMDTPQVVESTPTTTTYNVVIRGSAIKSLSEARVASLVRFQTPDVAKQNLMKSLDLAAPPTIDVVPDWIGRAMRVDVVVDTLRADAPTG